MSMPATRSPVGSERLGDRTPDPLGRARHDHTDGRDAGHRRPMRSRRPRAAVAARLRTSPSSTRVDRPSLDDDLAADDDGVDGFRPRREHEIAHRRETGRGFGEIGVADHEIGELAGFERAEIRSRTDRARAVDRAHREHVLCQQRIRLLRALPRGQQREEPLLADVEAAREVRCVRPQRDRHAASMQLDVRSGRRPAAAPQHRRGRTPHDTHATLGDRRELVVAHDVHVREGARAGERRPPAEKWTSGCSPRRLSSRPVSLSA